MQHGISLQIAARGLETARQVEHGLISLPAFPLLQRFGQIRQGGTKIFPTVRSQTACGQQLDLLSLFAQNGTDQITCCLTDLRVGMNQNMLDLFGLIALADRLNGIDFSTQSSPCL